VIIERGEREAKKQVTKSSYQYWFQIPIKKKKTLQQQITMFRRKILESCKNQNTYESPAVWFLKVKIFF
jgi:hypothetical protein